MQEWLELAEDGSRAAEHLRKLRPQPREIICFHYQQSAEERLEAVLQSYQVDTPKPHDLLVLLKHITTLVPAFEDLERECNELNDYAVAVRYPVRIDPTEENVEGAGRSAARIRDAVKVGLGY